MPITDEVYQTRRRFAATAGPIRSIVVILLAAIFLLQACEPKKPIEKTLTVGIENAPKAIDPRYSTDAYGMRISHHLIFSTLVQHSQDLRIVPNLAESWETPNPTTYIFHLARDVRFHDGSPLTASDVKFTFEHLKNPSTKSPFAGTYQIIDAIRVIDDVTVEFKLARPVASFLTSIIMPIVPRRLIEGDKDFGGTLVGSGPFRYVSQTPNEIILEKNPDYFLGAPKLDKVVFKIIKDDNTRYLKMKKGDLDLLVNAVSLKKVGDFKVPPLNDTYSVIEEPGLSYNYLGFNMKSEAMKDIRFRQAIAFAIDREEIIKYRMDDHAALSYSLLSSVNWFSEPSVSRYPYDPDQAKKLLDEMGLKDPDGDGPGVRATFDLKTSNNSDTVGIARIIQSQLAKVGIALTTRSYEWGTFYGDIKSGNFQMTLMAWVGVTEPDFYYDIFHSSQFPPSGRNRGLYTNEEVDRLTEAGRISLNPDKRKSIYADVQKIIAADLPYVSLWHKNNISIVHNRVTGYQQHPMGGYLSFWNIDVIN